MYDAQQLYDEALHHNRMALDSQLRAVEALKELTILSFATVICQIENIREHENRTGKLPF